MSTIKAGGRVRCVASLDALYERGVIREVGADLIEAASLEVDEVWTDRLWVRHPTVPSATFILPTNFFLPIK